jgi:predicted acyl esterase
MPWSQFRPAARRRKLASSITGEAVLDPDPLSLSRRTLLKLGGALSLYLTLPGLALAESGEAHRFLKVRDKVPDPENVFFEVQYPGKAPIKLAGHVWFNEEARQAGRKCPAIVEFNPYRRRDGTMIVDAKMYPWFAYHDYLCFRVDLQGSGDSEGVLTDEYTDEELAYCVQVIGEIAARDDCTGAVGMMGKSWSAINSLMVAARADRPDALKAVIVCAGSDDRWNDDVHYMGGAMMFDNVSWPSSMFGWMAAAPDPAVVGEAWQEMWRKRIDNADFWFRQWGGNQPRDDYWSESAVRGRYGDVGVPLFILSGWQDGYKNPVPLVIEGLTALGKESAGLIGAWGHKYPFNGYPGPRVDWLDYIVTHWWDRWLKGKTPPPEGAWPQLPVWLGQSKEPTNRPATTRSANGWPRTARGPRASSQECSISGQAIASATILRARPTGAPAGLCSTPRCWRRARGANAAMTICPAIRRASTGSRSISTARR